MTVDAARPAPPLPPPRAAQPIPPAGAAGVPDPARGPWRAARRRRRLPYLTAGGLLVVACVLAFAWTSAELSDRVAVLAVARPVAAGQPITAADLKQVMAVRSPELTWIAASDAHEVLGRTAAVPLVPDTLLTAALIGEPRFPPPGQTLASVALKPGQYPRQLGPGAHVAVYLTNNTGPTTADSASSGKGVPPATLTAVVLDTALTDGQGTTVVSLLLATDDAPRLASAPPAGLVLMQTAPGGE